ncbi:hypothetical protein M5D96_014135 [Drosophila gunungcola]|uniref:Uncharacterized protein n=1 Tax=Drosophila gunungcola TaxID=103775 RepID=A0A9Q0BIY1_9MUSC|nr:hypothetical protein M5D96_014135 [Drosophila gunungcola]
MTGLQWRPPQFPKRARIPVYCEQNLQRAL